MFQFQDKKTESKKGPLKDSFSKKSKKKKKAPVNRLATDPVVVARLKEQMSSALTSNPLVFDHLKAQVTLFFLDQFSLSFKSFMILIRPPIFLPCSEA